MKINIFPKMLSFVIPFLEVIKMVIASVASVALLGFAGLTLAGSAVGIIVSTPLFITFSPILVPATIATTVLVTGLTAGGSLGGTALCLIIWLIKHKMGVMIPPFGTFVDKPAGEAAPAGGAAPPTSEAAPASEAAPTGGSNPANGFKWSWSWGGKPFGGTPAGGGAPAGGLKWNWSWGGKSYSGTIPFGGTPAGGSTSAGGGTPAGGTEPASGSPTTE